MKKAVMLAITMVFALGLWLRAERKEGVSLALVTSFDFTRYPACSAAHTNNCIKGIRFYDADSNRLLAEAEARADMFGQQSIIGMAKASSIPRRAYAVTVYLDNAGRLSEGPRGQITEFVNHASR